MHSSLRSLLAATLVVFFGHGCAHGDAAQEGDESGFLVAANGQAIVVPQQTPTSPPSTTPATGSPAAAPNATVNPALLPESGFVIRATDYSGLCLASATDPPAVGSAVQLASCAAVRSQLFSMYDGALALQKTYCLTDQNTSDGVLALDRCVGDANRFWVLSPDTHVLYHNTAACSTRAVALPSANSSAGNAYLVALGASNTLHLAVDTAPGTQGSALFSSTFDGFCLAGQAGGPTVAACDATAAAQQWSLSNNRLRSAAGYCVTGDMNATPPLQITACGAGGLDATASSALWFIGSNTLLSAVVHPYPYQGEMQMRIYSTSSNPNAVGLTTNYGANYPIFAFGSKPFF